MTNQLTKEELELLITVLSQVSVPVAQAAPYIDLINKMVKMAQEASLEDVE